MTQENVDVIRRGFEKFLQTGDFDPEDFDPGFEFDNTNAMFEAEIYRGTEGLREFLSLMREMWAQLRFEPLEYIPTGQDQVVVPMRMIAVGRDGVETVAHAATVYTMREGKVARTKAFQSKADALESVGMQE